MNEIPTHTTEAILCIMEWLEEQTLYAWNHCDMAYGTRGC